MDHILNGCSFHAWQIAVTDSIIVPFTCYGQNLTCVDLDWLVAWERMMLKKVVMVPCWSGFVVILLSFNFSTHYTTDIIPKHKDTFFAEPGNGTHQYMLEPLPLSIIQTIASMSYFTLITMWDRALEHKWWE